jgi:hypothetical protein
MLIGAVTGPSLRAPADQPLGEAVPVLLRGDIKASSVDSECDPHCSQAYVEWQEHSYYYSIEIKGPNPMRNTLIKVANSALEFNIRR